MTVATDTSRFLLWVDGVGGFLVCLGDEIVLGQPAPRSPDIAILGDLSRDHATICRRGEGYLIVPRRTTRLVGREIREAASLADGAMMELGEGVWLSFRQPHPLSRTARLDFVSRHRTQPSTDGVLLMADACILGPSPACHVVCPDWKSELVITRRRNELLCRAAGRVTIDGRPSQTASVISRSSCIEGADFCIKLEELS